MCSMLSAGDWRAVEEALSSMNLSLLILRLKSLVGMLGLELGADRSLPLVLTFSLQTLSQFELTLIRRSVALRLVRLSTDSTGSMMVGLAVLRSPPLELDFDDLQVDSDDELVECRSVDWRSAELFGSTCFLSSEDVQTSSLLGILAVTTSCVDSWASSKVELLCVLLVSAAGSLPSSCTSLHMLKLLELSVLSPDASSCLLVRLFNEIKSDLWLVLSRACWEVLGLTA